MKFWISNDFNDLLKNQMKYRFVLISWTNLDLSDLFEITQRWKKSLVLGSMMSCCIWLIGIESLVARGQSVFLIQRWHLRRWFWPIYPKHAKTLLNFVCFLLQVINTYELRMSCWYEEEIKLLVAVTRYSSLIW